MYSSYSSSNTIFATLAVCPTWPFIPRLSLLSVRQTLTALQDDTGLDASEFCTGAPHDLKRTV